MERFPVIFGDIYGGVFEKELCGSWNRIVKTEVVMTTFDGPTFKEELIVAGFRPQVYKNDKKRNYYITPDGALLVNESDALLLLKNMAKEYSVR
jgi:hypothetical protein